VGHLTWVRVFSGVLKVGEEVYNPRTGKTERVGRIYRMHGNRREHATSLRAGDVMALVGIDSAITGDTLCHPKHPIALESFQFPEPVISVALTPPPDEERDRMHQSLGRLCAEDPTLRLSFDGETGEQLLSGMGELHLEVTVDRLRSEYGIQTLSSPPQVAYRETVRSRAEATGSYRKQTGGHGHFAVARVRVEPLPGDGRGDDAEMKVQFRSVTNPLEMPIQYVRAIEAGVREALEKGAIAGYPTTGVLVTLLGGRYHEIDSDSSDFRIAGSLAARQAMQLAEPALLEPVMRADILVHEDYLRKVMGDFLSRRGNVLELQIRGTMRALLGEVPLSGMRGYASVVRDLTQGRGSFTLEFRRYQLVPEETAQNIIAERQEAGKINRR
jgi:elongation factor G